MVKKDVLREILKRRGVNGALDMLACTQNAVDARLVRQDRTGGRIEGRVKLVPMRLIGK